MLQTPSLLVTVFAFLLLLGPLVVVHELGHFLVARLFGVKVDAFSVGFGKELAARVDRHGTRWKLSLLPLGGYVQFAGDENAMSAPAEDLSAIPPEQRAGIFHFRPLWQRSLIVVAGPVTNLVFAIVIFAAFAMAYGKPVASPEIAAFAENAPAQAAGMRIGDRITSIEGVAIESFTDIPPQIVPFPGRRVTIMVERDGRSVAVPVTIAEFVDRDRFGNEARIGRIGIAAGKASLVPVGPGESVKLGVEQSIGIMKMMVTGIGQIFSGERSVRELGGPVKIAKYSGEQFSLGWAAFTYFAALISINLAFINLLPIPGLDGGHLAFYAAEAVRRKPLGLRSQEWAIRTGLALVVALMLFVTINDIVSLPIFGGAGSGAVAVEK